MFSGIRRRLVITAVALSGLCVLAVSLYFLLVYDSQASTGTTLLHLALIALGLGSIAVGLALLIGSQIAGPINQLIDTLRQAAPGTSTPKIAAMRDDETGELIHSFNTMTDKFRKEYMQLAGERDRSSLILERMGDGIVVVDGQCRITAVNPAGLRIFNLDEVNAIGLSFIEAVRDYELEQPVRRCLKTRKLQQEYLDLKEKKLYLGLVVTPLAGESGCLVLVQDLSRLKKLEAIRRDFIANISHELRTPLSSIKLLAETLKDGSLDDGRVSADFMGRIASEAEKLAGIVEGMTNLARIESGEMRLKKQPVEIGAVINRAYQRLAEQITQKGLEYGFQSAENITVMVDEIQIEQVVYNLLDNAIKFTPRGGQLVVTVAMANRNLLVSVQDTGEGIDPDDINRIFERFYKADKARSSGGSGLGLAIARHIIEAHGGRIWAESQPGHGSLMCFTLPL